MTDSPTRSITIVSAIRLNSLFLFAKTENLTWDGTTTAAWSLIELNVGIVCACMPSMRALFANLGVKFMGSTTAGSRSANSKPVSKSGTLSMQRSQSSAPKRGDEGDFILLDDVHSVVDRKHADESVTNFSETESYELPRTPHGQLPHAR